MCSHLHLYRGCNDHSIKLNAEKNFPRDQHNSINIFRIPSIVRCFSICVFATIIITFVSIKCVGVDLLHDSAADGKLEPGQLVRRNLQEKSDKRWWIPYLNDEFYDPHSVSHKLLPDGFVHPNEPSRIFACALGLEGEENWMSSTEGALVAFDLFPTFSKPDLILVHSLAELNEYRGGENDILISHLWGTKVTCDFPPDMFSGKTMLFSGEPFYDHIPGERLYHLGHNPDDVNSVRISYTILRWIRLPPKQQLEIIDHDYKPHNTQKHFLMYAASNCITYRENIFDDIASLFENSDQEMHFGGACKGRNAASILKERLVDSSNIIDRETGVSTNYILYHDYRFALVMENSNLHGYISEKILNAFNAGSIPIFSGTSYVFALFNKDAIVYYDPENPSVALEQIKYLEENRTAYDEMLNQPILSDGYNTIKRYFSLSENVGEGFLRKRIRSMMRYDDPKVHAQQLKWETNDGSRNIDHLDS